MRACYSHDYCVPTRLGGLEKLGQVAQEVQRGALAELHNPPVLNTGHLYALHDPAYVDAFLQGEGSLAISQNLPWSQALRGAVLAMQAGQLQAAEMALRDGISAHIANGFHHARYARGRGFCTFNGLALVARAWPARRVFVLDCDDHGGDGTAEFTTLLDNLFNYSICSSSFDAVTGPRSVIRIDRCDGGALGTGYRESLEQAFEVIRSWRPHLLIYQAGVDCHRDDPLGRGQAGTEDLYARDEQVFRFARAQHLPLLFTLAGGYQSRETTVALHRNTFLAARRAYGMGVNVS